MFSEIRAKPKLVFILYLSTFLPFVYEYIVFSLASIDVVFPNIVISLHENEEFPVLILEKKKDCLKAMWVDFLRVFCHLIMSLY